MLHRSLVLIAMSIYCIGAQFDLLIRQRMKLLQANNFILVSKWFIFFFKHGEVL